MKAHPALFEGRGGGGEPTNEALLFQSTVDIHFQNANETFQSTFDIHFQNALKTHKNCKGSHSVRLLSFLLKMCLSFVRDASW